MAQKDGNVDWQRAAEQILRGDAVRRADAVCADRVREPRLRRRDADAECRHARTPRRALSLSSLSARRLSAAFRLRARQIAASADNPLNASGTCYSTRVMLGRRDDDVLEAYARTMVELIAKQAPDAGPLLLGISIKEHSNELFRAVMQQVVENRVW